MKKLLSILCGLLVVLSASAAERPLAKMRQIAHQRLMQFDGSRRSASQQISDLKLVDETATLGVFSNKTGFVVVSRDERFPEVLAYGSGSFDIDHAPTNMLWWYKGVQRGMQDVIDGKRSLNRAETRQAVLPILTTKWGQGAPYNNYAPVFESDKTKAPIGCVAVSMGQVMNYQQYPASAQFSATYEVDGDSKEYHVDVNSTYYWPYQDAYNYYVDADGNIVSVTTSPRQGNLVASLLRDCGYAANMTYTASGSGASSGDIAEALVNCFKYPVTSVKYRYRAFYTDSEWEDMMYSELEKGYPFIYNGSDAKGGVGHSFVAHGIDGDGLLYINWGWSGSSDGYYNFRLLNPDDETEYSKGQDIIIGIRKTALDTDSYQSMLGGYKYSFDYDNEERVFIIKNEGVYNYGGLPIIGRVGVVAENLTNPENTQVIDFMYHKVGDEYVEGDTLPSFYGYSAFTDSLDGGFYPGEYRLYMASRDYRDTEWQPMRIVNVGPIYYNMTVAADGTTTIGKTPVATAIERIAYDAKETEDPNAPVRYFDLQGREVSGDTKGLLIRKQGNSVKKVIVR